VFTDPVAEGDLQAARLALLVMRGAICERREVPSDQYLIDPDTSPVSREEAATLLARMPKPLECHARIDGELMRIRCRTISEPAQLRAREQDAAFWAEDGGYFPDLRRAHGDRYPELPIFCVGCDESLVVSASDVERWRRDYDVHPSGTNASPPSFYLPTNPESARAAVAAGAAYLMKCFFGPNDWAAEEEGRVIDLRDASTHDYPVVYARTPDLGSACERCGERPATWSATDTRATPWRERRLCEVCTAVELTPHTLDDAERFEQHVTALSAKGRQSVASDIASAMERMERRWKLLPMPPEVATALERCRRL